MVVGEPAQQLDRVGDVLVRHRQLRRCGAARRRAPSARWRIFGQSSTASRTSVSTRCSSSRSCVAAVRVAHRVDLDRASSSRRCRRRSASSGSTSAATSASAPSASRRTTTSGCTSRWTSRWCAVSSGGDRVDQERHVVGDDLDRPCAASVAAGSLMPQLQLARAAAARPARGGCAAAASISCGGVADQLLVGREPPVPVDQLRRASWSSPASATASATSRSALGTGSSSSASSASSAVGRSGSPVVERVDAGAGLPADAGVQLLAEHVAVDGGVELVRGPWPGLGCAGGTPVHRCHSPRPTTLWSCPTSA